MPSMPQGVFYVTAVEGTIYWEQGELSEFTCAVRTAWPFVSAVFAPGHAGEGGVELPATFA